MKIILVHGSVETSCEPPFLKALQRAALIGYNAKGNILDAVEESVKIMEDDPFFNAGFGSVLNLDGEVEMDAAIMDGETGRCGAVAAIQDVRYPVSIARKVMEETDHVLLAGTGAQKFARRMGYPYFDAVDHTQRDAWERAMNLRKLGKSENISAFTGLPIACDTVGCVALFDGYAAAGTSTGGTFLKLPGRVGDSPVIGGGIYASSHGAAVCTGRGESFIEIAGAVQAVNLMAQGMSPDEAGREIISKLSAKKVPGGILVVSSKGEYAAVHNSLQFPVALLIDGKLIENYKPVKI